MRASLYLISVVPLLFSAVFAGMLLAPNSREVALMHLRDLDFDTSFRSYTSLHAQGDHSSGVLVPLINLDLHYGKVDDAIALLEAFVKDRPDNVEGRLWLANLYKAAQKPHEACRVLEDLYRIRPSAETLRELADTYDFLGAYDQEMSALVRLFGRGDYTPREEDATTLAIFYRADGNVPAAAHVMDRLMEAKNYGVSLDAVDLAVRLWLDQGNPRQAFATGKAFLEKHPEEASALKLSEVFQAEGNMDYAYEILLPLISSGEMSAALEQQMVGVLLAQGKADLVFNFLRSRFADRRLPKELATTLIDLAASRREVLLMENVLKSLDFDEVPEETLMRYADLSIRLHRDSLAGLIEGGMSIDRLRDDVPVLAAVLRVAREPSTENIARLAKESALDDAPLAARLTVARIFIMNNALEPAQRLVRQMTVAEALSELEPMEYAALYLGDDTAAREAQERVQQTLAADVPSRVRSNAERAAFFIDVGLGDAAAVDAYLSSHMAQADRLDEETYDVASRFHQDKLVLDAARRLYAREPSTQNRDRIVEALLASKRYAEALQLLQGDRGSLKLSTYIDVLSLWAQTPPTGKERGDMQKHFEFVLRRLEPHSKEMRDMGYVLQKAGFRQEAENILATLADGQPFASKDTQDLLAYWGPNPSEGALGWVKTRAQFAPDGEKGTWFGYLNAINKPQVVLELMKDRTERLPVAALDSYIDALVLTRAPELGEILAREVSLEMDITRLKKLATTAEQENAASVSEKAWRKVYELDAHDTGGLKRVALQELRAGHFSKALPMLEAYLQSEPDDYQANYAYAEVMRRNDKDAAKAYYDKALAQALEIGDESISMRLAEANLVYRSRGLDESAALFHKLIDQYPEDKTVRADFVEILLENKRYDEASNILAR